MGDSISGRNNPVSESSYAIAPSYLNNTSINNCLSGSERNPVPIFIAAIRSEVSRDPRGTTLRSVSFTGVTFCGLIPSDKGIDRTNLFVLALVHSLNLRSISLEFLFHHSL